MCSEPVTFGGGMTMREGRLVAGRGRPEVPGRLPTARTVAALPRRAGTGRQGSGRRGVGHPSLSVTLKVYGALPRTRRAPPVDSRTVAAMSDAHLTERPLDERSPAGRADRGADPAEHPRPRRRARRATGGRSRRRRIALDRRAGGRPRRRRRAGRRPAGGCAQQKDTQLTHPDRVAGLHPRRQRAGAAAPPTTCAAAWPPTSSWTAASARSTATRPTTKRSVLLFGGTTLLWQPERDLDSLFGLMADETGTVTGLREVPPAGSAA